MIFSEKDRIYTLILISDAQNNILGVSFDEFNSNKIEILKWPVKKLIKYKA